MAIMSQAFKPSNEIQVDGRSKDDYTELIKRFEEDMVSLKRNNKDYTKSITKLQQAIKLHDDVLKKDK